MMNTLYAAFRKFAMGKISAAIAVARCYSTQQSSNVKVSRLISNSHSVLYNMELSHSIKFRQGTLNIDFGMPANENLIRNIIEMPIAKIPPLQEPIKHLPIQYDFPVSEKSIDLPTSGKIIEKQAVRLIVIRHKKIKKHKRKKLRKKMKYEWAKIRIKRNQKKEKIFQTELISKIKEAEAFNAKEYVKEKLNILNKEILPRTYRGEILPADMIKQFLEQKKAKKDYLRNKPRLTL